MGRPCFRLVNTSCGFSEQVPRGWAKHIAPGSCLYEPIKKLVTAGLQAGLDVAMMIDLLNGGMSITDLVTYIESCRAAN